MKNEQCTSNDTEAKLDHWSYNTPIFYAQKFRILTADMKDFISMTSENIKNSTDWASAETLADECEEFIYKSIIELSRIVDEIESIINSSESVSSKGKVIEFRDGRQYFTIEDYEKVYYSARQIRNLRENSIMNSDLFGPVELVSINFWILSSFCGGFGDMEKDFDLFSREMFSPKKENVLKFQNIFVEKLVKINEELKKI